jgi:hypothetical protein
VPSDKGILIQLGGYFDTYPCPNPDFKPAPGQSLEQFLKEDAASVVDGYIGTGQVPFGLKIDGKVVLTYDQVLQSRRVSTDLFDLTGHPSMSFLDECVTGSSQQAVADIFLAVVVETPVGTHTFEVFDDTGTTTATIYVTISSADSVSSSL